MKDFDHLMSVWQEQPKHDQLSVDEVLKQVKKGMNSMGRKLLLNIAVMATLFTGFAAIMLFFVFKLWITYAGIAIILITIISFTFMMVRDYRLINSRDATINPVDYLQNLKEYQKNRAKVYGWLFYLYVLLISLGLGLYFFEVLQYDARVFQIGAYGLSAIWFLFCTFYLRKRFVKSEQEKLSLMIDRLARLQKQFD
jgi:hypothetical protein